MPPPDIYQISVYDLGSPNNPLKFKNQDYHKLHQNCLSRNMQYIDELFPANSSSIGNGLLCDTDMAQVEWKRPFEIVSKPSLIVNGVSRFDYAQGPKLGDCWFLASIGALSTQKDFMDKVIPAEQSFNMNYAGIFHFRFWRFGKWVDVVIDDQLPTINNKLVFVASKTPCEFWPALLEKAYAKLCGSFTDLLGGFSSEALIDFTGGVHMHFKLQEAPNNLWNVMYCAFNSKTLISSSTHQGATSMNTVLPNGLVESHAYTVTGVCQIMSKGQPVRLVRMFNPWGKNEWTGDWSDKSSLWQTVSADDCRNCLHVAENGEFWMSVEDFIQSFSTMDICCLSPDFLNDSPKCSWTLKRHFGQWTTGTAGGGKTNLETFWTNPQFRVRIEKLDEDCAGGRCPENILVSLMQNQEKRHRKQLANFFIGFYVFEIPPEVIGESGDNSAMFFNNRKPVQSTDFFLDLREVMKFFRLEPGDYLIVPSTLNPNEEASFVLSVFTKIQCTQNYHF